MADIHKLIAAISPETYCERTKEDNGKMIDLTKKIRKMVEEKGYNKEVLDQVKISKIVDLPFYQFDEAKADALNLWGLKSPREEHKLLYDSPTEGLEPVYFWILDFVGNIGFNSIEKVTDNFVSSPGSGHFSEMQGKATQMQQEVSRTMGAVNTVLKSVLNLVYDLKEFRVRLKPYKIYKDEKTNEKEKYNQLLSLKQIWLDNVDIRKGRGSINALSSGELDFVTLRDAFMTIRNSKQAFQDLKDGGLDLNDRVKRILQQRSQEFFNWIDESYYSLKQRYDIERNYLKTQVETLKMYSKWIKPYLVASQKLTQDVKNKSAALVNVFNTTLLELQLIATSEYDIKDDVVNGLVPDLFKKINFDRKYYKVLVIELEFRGMPQRVTQRDWAYGGKTEVKFTSYALNNQELDILKREIDKDDLNQVLKLVEGTTEDTLNQMKTQIAALIEDKEESEIEKREKDKKDAEEEKKKKKGDDFGIGAFFSMFKIKKKEGPKFDKEKAVLVTPDNEYEKVVRSQAALEARNSCFTVFDTYKKAHGMPSHSNPFDPQ